MIKKKGIGKKPNVSVPLTDNEIALFISGFEDIKNIAAWVKPHLSTNVRNFDNVLASKTSIIVALIHCNERDKTSADTLLFALFLLHTHLQRLTK